MWRYISDGSCFACTPMHVAATVRVILLEHLSGMCRLTRVMTQARMRCLSRSVQQTTDEAHGDAGVGERAASAPGVEGAAKAAGADLQCLPDGIRLSVSVHYFVVQVCSVETRDTTTY